MLVTWWRTSGRTGLILLMSAGVQTVWGNRLGKSILIVTTLLKISYVYIMCFDPVHPLSLPSPPSLSATISLPTSCALSLYIFLNLLSLFSVAFMFMSRGPPAGAQ